MTLTLDAATEQRIQREIDRGIYRDPTDVINHALDLLTADENSSYANKAVAEARRKALDESFGAWSGKNGDGVEYQQRLREEW